MWTSTIELNLRRVLLARALGLFWRGAYFSSFSPLQVQNVARQQLPARNWVRVRNKLAGICGSDLHFIYADGDFRIAGAALPSHKRSYPGHEVVGEVIEVGEDVTHVQVGDRVALQYGQNCLTTGTLPMCRACARGDYNLCEQGQFSGPEPIGGGWSEEMLVHEQQVFRVPEDLSDGQAMLLEPTSVAVHSVLRALPKPDDHVLIIGAGTIGLLVLQTIRALAPQTTVSVMARYPFQVEQATRMGATHILYPQGTYQSVEQATGAKLYTGMFGNKALLGGYDAIYDTIGTQKTLSDALRWTRAGGTLMIVGVSLHLMRLDLTPVWFQEVNVIGSMGQGMESWPIGTRQRRPTFAVAADLIAQGLLHPEKLITHHFPLTNFRQALSTASDKGQTRAIKVAFDYALLPASVVPNVRSTARQRRPVRATTAAWPAHGQAGGATVEEEEQVMSAPVGQTWSQNVQPFPPAPVEPAMPFAPDEFVAPINAPEDPYALPDTPLAPAEYIPSTASYMTDEPEAEILPFVTDEPAVMYTTDDEPAMTFTIDEEVYAETQHQADAVHVAAEETQWEPGPEPIVFAPEPAESAADRGETPGGSARDRGGSYRKAGGRKTGGHRGATKDTSETLQE